jgi:hypothetical protein
MSLEMFIQVPLQPMGEGSSLGFKSKALRYLGLNIHKGEKSVSLKACS